MENPMNSSPAAYRIGDDLLQQIWHDVDEKVSLARVGEVAFQFADKYREATVTAFIPLLIRRMTKERLQAEIVQHNAVAPVAGLGDAAITQFAPEAGARGE
jgi:hypothetical protein